MNRLSCRLGLAAALVVLVGCAGNVPKPTYADPNAQRRLLDADDRATVSVKAAPGVEVLGAELQSLTELIQRELATKQALNPADGEAEQYTVEVLLSRFEKGNAFARAMLAGVGQIHIGGTVSLLGGEPSGRIDEFAIEKTFAWGGIYGGATRIEDLLPVFAEGVAAALTGQSEETDEGSGKAEDAGK